MLTRRKVLGGLTLAPMVLSMPLQIKSQLLDVRPDRIISKQIGTEWIEVTDRDERAMVVRVAGQFFSEYDDLTWMKWPLYVHSPQLPLRWYRVTKC